MKYGAEVAEFFGTFALVLAACGAIVVNELLGHVGHMGISAVFGLIIAGMIYAVGHISGAHFNPAVSIAFATTGHFPWQRVPSYVGAQCTGALAGALVLRGVLGNVAQLGATQPASILDATGLIAIEFLLTMTLMFVIAGVATDGRAVGTMAGVAIGGTVALSATWAGPLTGASMNPARSLGPALASGTTDWLLHYLVVPCIGAIAGALLYEAIRKGNKPTKEAR